MIIYDFVMIIEGYVKTLNKVVSIYQLIEAIDN